MDEINENAETVNGTKANKLGADMAKLAGLDFSIAVKEEEEDNIWIEINSFKKEKGFDLLLDRIIEIKSDLRKQYNLLKTDIGKRGLSLYEKTGEKKPALGCEIKMYKNRELTVDREAAVKWAVDNEHLTLLDIFDNSYSDLIVTGVFPDMPGKVDDSKIPKATISIKPYQNKE